MTFTRERLWLERCFTWWGAPLIVACASVLVYANTFDVPFYLDDFPAIVDNPNIKDLDNLTALWLAAKPRFLGYLTFALNFHFHGARVQGFHLVNILIHAGAGTTVLFMLKSLLRTPVLREMGIDPRLRRGLPLLAALLFVVHPLQTQAVTYVVQRLTSLAALLYLGSMTCYVKARLSSTMPRSAVWGAATAVLGVLAIFTKQNAATLPLAWLLLEAAFFRTNARRLVLGGAALVIGAGAAYVGTTTVLDIEPFSLESMTRLTQETEMISRSQYLSTQGRVLLTYMRLFVWPTGQHLDWDYPLGPGLSSPLTVSVLGFHGVVIGLALVSLRRFPLIAFSVCFFYLAHSVESSVIPIRDVVFEHRTYLPNLGLCVLASWLALQAMQRWNVRTVAPLVAAGLTILGTATVMRNALWSDKIAFLEDNVAKASNKARPHLNLGRAYERAGETEKAIRAFQRALELKPGWAKAHSNLGAVYGRSDDLEKALFHIQKAIEIEPGYAAAHNNLGTLLARSGRLDLAVVSYLRALDLEPQYSRTRVRLAEIYIRQSRFRDAEHELRVALVASPNSAGAHNLLGVTLQAQDRIDEATRSFEQALQLDPTLTNASYNLGLIYTRQGRADEAIRALSEVLRRDPSSVQVNYLLGLNLARKGRFDRAVRLFQRCLELDPDHREARANLEQAEKALREGR